MKRKSVLTREIDSIFHIHRNSQQKCSPTGIFLRSARGLWEVTNMIKIQWMKVSDLIKILSNNNKIVFKRKEKMPSVPTKLDCKPRKT